MKHQLVIHQIEYMPSVEQFSEQRDNWATPYKFTSKELDQETGLYYYGARYYTPEIGIWLSVDPLSDERPSLSPYNYCQLNPVMRVDPTGMLDDEFGVTSTGEVKLLKRKSGDHELYKLDNNGKKVDVNGDGKMSEGTDFVKFGRKDVKKAYAFPTEDIDSDGFVKTESFGINIEFSNQKSAENIFDFITCQKNTDTWKTDIEWSLQDYSGKSDNVSILYTTREEGSVNGTYYKAAKMANRGYVLNRSIHNHPTNDPTPSPGDIENKANLRELSPNSKFQIQTIHGRKNY